MILFEDGDWKIGKSEFGVFVIHHCESPRHDKKMRDWWWRPDRKECVWCKTKVPEALRGLALLHAWDR